MNDEVKEMILQGKAFQLKSSWHIPSLPVQEVLKLILTQGRNRNEMIKVVAPHCDLNPNNSETPLVWAKPENVAQLLQYGAFVDHIFPATCFETPSILCVQPVTALVYAGYDADAQKVSALFKAGATKNDTFANMAVRACVEADHTTMEQKRSCLWTMQQNGIDLYADKKMMDCVVDAELKNWLEENREARLAQKRLAKAKQERIIGAHTRD